MKHKIKLGFIVPTAFIPTLGKMGQMTLALSHLIDLGKVNEYEKAIREAGLPILLDNGTFENGTPEGIDSLLIKGSKVGATHIFAPDHLYDAKKTRESLEQMVEAVAELRLAQPDWHIPKIAAVCQANTLEEYLEEFEYLVKHPRVDLIGLSILTIPHVFGTPDKIEVSRYKMLEILDGLPEKKDCHLLGLGSSYIDVLSAAERYPWVVSNDTSSCFQNGLYGRAINDKYLEVDKGKIEHKVDFDLKEISREQSSLIHQNIATVLTRFSEIYESNQS